VACHDSAEQSIPQPRGNVRRSKMSVSTISLVLAVYVQPGLQFSTTENESPDDRSIVTIDINKAPKMLRDQNDYIFNEVENQAVAHNSSKRASWDFYAMIKCGTGCNPLVYKGYGCYCGFLGSGNTVDGIDWCCKMHDWCYSTTSCNFLAYNLPYFVPYKWSCNGGSPVCSAAGSSAKKCSYELCECDRTFVKCLSKFACPKSKAMCTSPWRYFQNLFMGLGTGMPMAHDHHHHNIHGPDHPKKPKPPFKYPKPIFTDKFRLNMEIGV